MKSREKAKNHNDSKECTNLQNVNERLQSEFSLKSSQYVQLNE